tara:strand:- start:266 stop:460 length:195 start_codon:yes stop_codon:yes gene_type:complete
MARVVLDQVDIDRLKASEQDLEDLESQMKELEEVDLGMPELSSALAKLKAQSQTIQKVFGNTIE